MVYWYIIGILGCGYVVVECELGGVSEQPNRASRKVHLSVPVVQDFQPEIYTSG